MEVGSRVHIQMIDGGLGRQGRPKPIAGELRVIDSDPEGEMVLVESDEHGEFRFIRKEGEATWRMLHGKPGAWVPCPGGMPYIIK